LWCKLWFLTLGAVLLNDEWKWKTSQLKQPLSMRQNDMTEKIVNDARIREPLKSSEIANLTDRTWCEHLPLFDFAALNQARRTGERSSRYDAVLYGAPM